MLGFQRIYDLSALSLKLLNDQLESMWRKVMGGIDLKDTSRGLQGVIHSKANATDVDTLGQRVREAETVLVQTSEQIALSASKSEVALLDGRVSQAEASLVVQADKIASSVSQDALHSLIEQSGDSIRMAVGDIGGNNLLCNSTAGNGMQGWSKTFSGPDEGMGAISTQEGWPCFRIVGAMNYLRMIGQEVPLTGQLINYTLSAEVKVENLRYGSGGGSCVLLLEQTSVEGVKTQASCETLPEGTQDWHKVVVTANAKMWGRKGKSMLVGFQMRNATGTLYVRNLKLEEGDVATAYSPAANEISSSSVSIFEDTVRIDSRNFELKMRNAQGDLVLEMNADANGFRDLVVAKTLTLRGREIYLPEGNVHLWVHPTLGGVVGVRRSADTPPLTSDFPTQCFRNAQDALDSIPRWCDADVTLHLQGTSTQFYEQLSLCGMHGGGSVRIIGWMQRPYIRGVTFKGNSALVELHDVDVVTTSQGSAVTVQGGYAYMNGVRAFGFDKTGYYNVGFAILHGGSVYMEQCEAYLFYAGLRAVGSARVGMSECKGRNLVYGVSVETCSQVMQYGAAFPGETNAYVETGSGKVIMMGVPSTGSTLAPLVASVESTAMFYPRDTRTYIWREGQGWRGDSTLYQGYGPEGSFESVCFFDVATLRQTLGSRAIGGAKLTLARCTFGGNSGAEPIYLCGYTNTGITSSPNRVRTYGCIGVLAWGEQRALQVPSSAVDDLRTGVIQSLGFFDSYATLALEGVGSKSPMLTVNYY